MQPLRHPGATPAWRPEGIPPSPDVQDLMLVDRVLDAFDIRDLSTGGHLQRMAVVTGLLGERMGMTPSEAWTLRIAASLHDIGKLMVSARILQKPGALTEDERAVVERHALAGHQMLSGPQTPIFKLAAMIALTHHERWDGNGYPLGLSGEAIPFGGRIAAVADVFDALLSTRPYRAALDPEEAIHILGTGSGSAFDPAVVDALFEDLDAALAARSSCGGRPRTRWAL